MSEFVLNKEFVTIKKKENSWQDAIRHAAQPLLNGGYIETSYVDAMVESVNEHGPYIVIAPHIAMPHARPETGANKVGYTLTLLEEPVAFSEEPDHQVRFLFTLACADSETHLEMLQWVVGILGDDDKLAKIMQCQSEDELMTYFGGNNE